jgi:hypothetical protein
VTGVQTCALPIWWQKDAYQKLVFLKGHLGKLKGYLGEPSPYKPAATAEAIPPTDAVYTDPLPAERDELTEINYLRSEIDRLKRHIGAFMDLDDVQEAGNKLTNLEFYFFQCSKLRVVQLADEASMCYGMRLRELGEKAKATKENG